MDEKLRNPLSEELVRMSEKDQAMRNKSMQGEPWDSSIDVANTERLKAIVQKCGWPTISEFGVEGAQAAWLIAQHADHDVDFQSECLELMKKENPDELNPTQLAYLEDRVRVN